MSYLECDIVFLENHGNLAKDDKIQIPEISLEDIDDIDLLIQEKNDFTIPGNENIFFILLKNKPKIMTYSRDA